MPCDPIGPENYVVLESELGVRVRGRAKVRFWVMVRVLF